MNAEPFTAPSYDIEGAELSPIEPDTAEALGAAIAAIEPWRTLGFGAPDLARFLAREERGARKLAIVTPGGVAGAVCLRHPFLRGAYLELLAILPAHQGRGLGHRIIDWTVAETSGRVGNLWTCVSAFNSRALAFFEKQGFRRVGALPDLVRDGFSEIFLRRRL